jgi:hypothetical protein
VHVRDLVVAEFLEGVAGDALISFASRPPSASPVRSRWRNCSSE